MVVKLVGLKVGSKVDMMVAAMVDKKVATLVDDLVERKEPLMVWRSAAKKAVQMDCKLAA